MKSKMPKSRAKTAYGLLSEVKQLITEEPLRLDMSLVCRASKKAISAAGLVAPDCGTVGCIAGWVQTLKGNRRTTNDFRRASKILGLKDEDQEDALFCPDALMFDYTTQTAGHAYKTVKHISRFQKKYSAQLKAKRV